MTVATVGSLCSGIGGLELAVEQVFGARTVWQAETDPDAATVLEARFPGVPNHNDITTTDWAAVEQPTVMCMGFPCQDLSYAGLGAGIQEGTRSGLWFDCLRAVRMVRPRWVVVENVPALVRRRAGLDFTIVLSGLAEAGYDTEWLCLRASDVGACHRRERVFILGWDRTAAPDTGGVSGRLHPMNRTPTKYCSDGCVDKARSKREQEQRTEATMDPQPETSRSMGISEPDHAEAPR